MEKVYVPRSLKEKEMQRALIQYRNPEYYDIVKKALMEAGRNDLIGYDRTCLISPRKAGGGFGREGRGQGRKDRPSSPSGNQSGQTRGKGASGRPSTGNKGSRKEKEPGKYRKKSIRNIHKKKK